MVNSDSVTVGHLPKFMSKLSHFFIKHAGHNNERVVGHIPIRLSNFVHMFLSLQGSHLEAEVTGGRIIRGRGYGLEVPCNYCLTGQEKAI